MLSLQLFFISALSASFFSGNLFLISANYASISLRTYFPLKITLINIISRLIVKICIVIRYYTINPWWIYLHNQINNLFIRFPLQILYQSFIYFTNCPIVRDLISAFSNIVKWILRDVWDFNKFVCNLFNRITMEYICIIINSFYRVLSQIIYNSRSPLLFSRPIYSIKLQV